jgi:hypothetical protein
MAFVLCLFNYNPNGMTGLKGWQTFPLLTASETKAREGYMMPLIFDKMQSP